MSIRVERAGWFTTVQDVGRSGYQRHGVSPGGAMDAAALRVANLLVGNPESSAGLEMTAAGPTLLFESEALVAVCGGDLDPRIDGQVVPAWRALAVARGTRMAFGGRRRGWRAYLAVAGGIATPIVLGSRSTAASARRTASSWVA